MRPKGVCNCPFRSGQGVAWCSLDAEQCRVISNASGAGFLSSMKKQFNETKETSHVSFITVDGKGVAPVSASP